MQPRTIIDDMKQFAIKCNLEVFGSINGMTAEQIKLIANEADRLHAKAEKERPNYSLAPQLPFQKDFERFSEMLANYQKILREAYELRKKLEEEPKNRKRMGG
jgi:hypothetical protein